MTVNMKFIKRKDWPTYLLFAKHNNTVSNKIESQVKNKKQKFPFPSNHTVAMRHIAMISVKHRLNNWIFRVEFIFAQTAKHDIIFVE